MSLPNSEQERGVFLKEYNLKMYSVAAYYIGKVIPEIPVTFVNPMIESSIMYFMINLDSGAEKFFKFYLTAVLMALCGS